MKVKNTKTAPLEETTTVPVRSVLIPQENNGMEQQEDDSVLYGRGQRAHTEGSRSVDLTDCVVRSRGRHDPHRKI